MRLIELMETLTKPLNHGNPFVVLNVKYYYPHGEALYFTYKGCVIYAKELYCLPQVILDKPVLLVKEGDNEFGLTKNNTIVPIEYIIEIAF